MENPLVKNNSRTYLITVIVIMGLSFFLLLYFLFDTNVEISILDSLITSLFFALISLSLWYPTNYISLDNYSLEKVILNNILIAIVATSLWLYLSYLIVTTIFHEYEEFFLYTSIWRFTIGLLLFIISIILNYVIIYYNNFTEKVLSESNFNALITEAELKSLKYQINPHFLFNALNSISSLTISNPEKAQEMSINLSDFLRKTLSGNDIKKISLKEEIESIELYLKIEKVRFEKRLEFNLDITEECKDILIPNMILQPLIENAIKHGVYESSERVEITLSCRRKENIVEIKISNNYDPSAVSNIGEGIGLSNINRRLKLIYQRTNLVSITKLDNIFSVLLLIPIDDSAIKDFSNE
ncbi:MAG: histidine kinase [Melioribacteraceae bacterium]|nr:histidine kinase [Melioribacteraceae bacterium]